MDSLICPFGESHAEIPRRGVIVRIQHREKHISSNLSAARCLVTATNTLRHAFPQAKTTVDSGGELSNELGISRITVKPVYEQPVAEGYAQAQTGAGTFVAKGLEFEVSPRINRVRRLKILVSVVRLRDASLRRVLRTRVRSR